MTGAGAGAAPADPLVVLRALAEPHRLALVRALRLKERCVRDLVAVSGLSQPLVSHHLGALAAAGLVSSRQANGFTYYALAAPGVDRALESLRGILDSASLPAPARPGGNDNCCR